MARNNNTSSTGGYLSPTIDVTTEQVEDIIQEAIVQITGLSGSLVRPAYQSQPPNQPDAKTTWCSFFIAKDHDLPRPTQITKKGKTYIVTHSPFEVQITFYGPAALETAKQFKKGLWLTQNLAELRRKGNIAVTEAGEVILMRELVNSAWLPRADMWFYAIRESVSEVEIYDLVEGQVELNTDVSTLQK